MYTFNVIGKLLGRGQANHVGHDPLMVAARMVPSLRHCDIALLNPNHGVIRSVAIYLLRLLRLKSFIGSLEGRPYFVSNVAFS